jgi:peptidoglycan hydrolase-like protein with peptidoglycan-binding domain
MTQWGSKYLGDQGYSALDILRQFYGYEIYLDQAKKVEGIPMSFPGYALNVGSAGPDTRRIQEQLNTISQHYPAIPKVIVDGIYGPKTQESVKAFQSIFKMPVSGVVDFATWYRIASIYVAVTRMAELY